MFGKVITRVAANAVPIFTILGALVALFSFFAVKPLAHVEIRMAAVIDDDRCKFQMAIPSDRYANPSDVNEIIPTPKGVQNLYDNLGSVIYLSLSLDGDFIDESDDHLKSGKCTIGVKNAIHDESGASLWGTIDYSSFLEVDVVEPLSDEEDGFEDAEVILLVPNGSSDFISADSCEGYCHQLRGPVRVQRAFMAEGFLGIKLVPVNIYENAYLTSRYECRLEILKTGYEFIAPLICAL
ncbi:hypothetical protein DFR52_10347 [Hoeflea marina]|uniref:Uncharacterized protein n=1 Tax=Hoeflea marina TaxID=274592 RepID=A0A317PMY8_9HYPH|nr:hypothetical protein [Hoeflea marina]PWV99850.1 hypothetical protein DFR52_10347 [Hoeflea marina]